MRIEIGPNSVTFHPPRKDRRRLTLTPERALQLLRGPQPPEGHPDWEDWFDLIMTSAVEHAQLQYHFDPEYREAHEEKMRGVWTHFVENGTPEEREEAKRHLREQSRKTED